MKYIVRDDLIFSVIFECTLKLMLIKKLDVQLCQSPNTQWKKPNNNYIYIYYIYITYFRLYILKTFDNSVEKIVFNIVSFLEATSTTHPTLVFWTFLPSFIE